MAVTYTLNNSFGNGITAPGLGFLLNDEMDDFAAKPGVPNMFGVTGGDANAIEPGKRPLSSMTPTIITKDGKLFMVVGAPGGSRITTGVLQVILDVLDFHMNPQDAVDLPRFHRPMEARYALPAEWISARDRGSPCENGLPDQTYRRGGKSGGHRHNDGVLEGGTESRLNGKVAGY